MRKITRFYAFFHCFIILECPFSVLENGNLMSVSTNRGDIHIRSTYHKVLVNDRVVDSKLVRLFFAILFIIAKKVGKASAERKMAGGIFIKECVIEEKSRLSYGRGVGNERALAKVCSTLVHSDKLAKERLILFSSHFNGLTALKFNPEVINKLTAVGERL